MPWDTLRTSSLQDCEKLGGMTSPSASHFEYDAAAHQEPHAHNTPHPSASATDADKIRDIAEVPAVEVITTAAVHLMSAAAVKLGLAEGPDAEELKDLDEARKLITALAGLITAGAPEVGNQHARPLRDGLRTLQLAFREASLIQDEPGKGPGEKFTGPVN
ncbi:hypothetical protein GCM10009861_15100 [Neomicrococcus aestuarii]